MRIRSVQFVWVFFAGVAALVLAGAAAAQAPAQNRAVAAKAPAAQVHANLAQLMRGIVSPASNVVFFAQANDPAAVKVTDATDTATATDPLMNAYGGWQAVENAGLAMAEFANLLTVPGRRCANGRPVPMDRADWPKFVQGLRTAGMSAFKAGQSKNQDNILAAAEEVVTACSNCHDVYREKDNLADRCTP